VAAPLAQLPAPCWKNKGLAGFGDGKKDLPHLEMDARFIAGPPSDAAIDTASSETATSCGES